MEQETSKEFENIPITFKNLDTSKYIVQATQDQVTSVTVIVKGVDDLLNSLKPEDITAYIDLANLTDGTFAVPVMVSGTDNKLTYTSRTTSVEIVIKKK